MKPDRTGETKYVTMRQPAVLEMRKLSAGELPNTFHRFDAMVQVGPKT